MKKFFVIFALLAAVGQALTIDGQTDVVDEALTFGSDSAIQIRHLAGQWHRDTSTSDTSQHWKRQDNTSDSCSNPVFLGRVARPVWKYAIRERVYTRDQDSSTTVWRMEVRWFRLQRRSDTAWGPWVKKGKGVGTVNDPVQDSVVMANVGGTAATWQARYGLFFLGDGVQARACPDNITGTGGQSTDTLIIRNPRLIGR